jgi:hypothetical protein
MYAARASVTVLSYLMQLSHFFVSFLLRRRVLLGQRRRRRPTMQDVHGGLGQVRAPHVYEGTKRARLSTCAAACSNVCVGDTPGTGTEG